MSLCEVNKVTKVTAVTDTIFLLSKASVCMCVAQYENVVVVFDTGVVMDNDLPFVALTHTFCNSKEAYRKCMFLVGKLCKKQASSKYFTQHNYQEHLRNGDFDHVDVQQVIDVVKEVKKKVDEFVTKSAH